MFASLGFRVDTTGLVNFKNSISKARGEMTNLGRGIKHTTGQLRGLARELRKVDTQLDKIKGGAANTRIKQAYNDIASSVRRLDTALNSITRNRPATTKAIGKINSSVFSGIPHWNAYRESVVRTRIALRNLNGDLRRLRANSRIDIRVRNSGGQGGGGGGSGGGGGLGGAAAGFGLRGFLGNMLPSMALSGLGAAAGFAAVNTVQAAREQTSMESMILMVSKSGLEFKNTVDYINKEAVRLGLNAADFGKSFAQVSMSAENLTNSEKKEMFTGFSEFMMAMGTNADDQKGIFRAFNQMFSNNRILQEEINQLSDRGIPATLIYDSAMKAYNLDNVAQVKKLQEAGKLDPSKVLKLMANMLQDKAHDSGAFEKMQKSSMFKQNQFMSQLRLSAKEIMDSGLDEMLGQLFETLTVVVQKIKELVVVTVAGVKAFNKLRGYIGDLTDGNYLLQLALFVVIFRFKNFVKAAALAARVLGTNGGVLKAIAAILRGVFGRALGSIILRFGIWGLAIAAVSKALGFLYNELEQGKMGNWTFFDEMSLRAEAVSKKVRALVDDLLWFQTFVTSGAMMNSGFDEVLELGLNKSRSLLDPTPYMAKTIRSGLEAYAWTNKMLGKGGENPLPQNNSAPIPYAQESAKPSSLTANFYRNGVLEESVQAPVFMNP